MHQTSLDRIRSKNPVLVYKYGPDTLEVWSKQDAGQFCTSSENILEANRIPLQNPGTTTIPLQSLKEATESRYLSMGRHIQRLQLNPLTLLVTQIIAGGCWILIGSLDSLDGCLILWAY